MAAVDERVLHIADRLHHEKPLPLAIDGLMVLVVKDCRVGPDADIEIPVSRSLPEKLNMAAMQKVIAAGNEYFLFWHNYIRQAAQVEKRPPVFFL